MNIIPKTIVTKLNGDVESASSTTSGGAVGAGVGTLVERFDIEPSSDFSAK